MNTTQELVKELQMLANVMQARQNDLQMCSDKWQDGIEKRLYTARMQELSRFQKHIEKIIICSGV